MSNIMFSINILSILLSIAGLYYINKHTTKFGPAKTLNLIFVGFLSIGIAHITSLRDLLHTYHTPMLPIFQILILITYIIEVRVIKCKGNWLPSDILNNLPDMLWMKDNEGKYLYANNSTCEKLLLMGKEDIIGKTSLEIASENLNQNIEYDFGEICDDSDSVVISSRKPKKFLEVGKIVNGFFALQVIKAPVYDKKGNIRGTVGCGRDLTDDLKEHIKLQKLYENKNFEDFEKLFEEHKYRYLTVERKKCPNCTSFEEDVDV